MTEKSYKGSLFFYVEQGNPGKGIGQSLLSAVKGKRGRGRWIKLAVGLFPGLSIDGRRDCRIR